MKILCLSSTGLQLLVTELHFEETSDGSLLSNIFDLCRVQVAVFGSQVHVLSTTTPCDTMAGKTTLTYVLSLQHVTPYKVRLNYYYCLHAVQKCNKNSQQGNVTHFHQIHTRNTITYCKMLTGCNCIGCLQFSSNSENKQNSS